VQDLAAIITGLGCKSENIADTDLIADGLVLLKVIDKDGGVRLWMGYSEGMSWIERLGMLNAAHDMELPTRNAQWADRDDD
jgi:hypothetical protein